MNLFFINGMWSHTLHTLSLSQTFKHAGYSTHLYNRDFSKTSTLALLYEDLKKEVAKVENPILIGHSMGGFLALKLCQENLAQKVVAICPALSGNFNQVNATKLKVMYPALYRKKFLISKEDSSFLMMEDLGEGLQKQLFDDYEPEWGSIIRSFAYRFPETWLNKDLLADKQIMMIAGKKDKICPAKGVEKMARLLKAQELKVYNSSHYPHMSPECSQKLYWDICDFLYSKKGS